MIVQQELVTAHPEALQEYFARSARHWPNAVAIDIPPGVDRPHRTTVSYRQLQRRCGTLAAAVYDSVGGSGRIVAILLPRDTADLYAAQLAVLTAGSAFVCVDPAFPDEQLDHILYDAGAALLVTDRQGARRTGNISYAGPVLRVETAAGPATEPSAPSAADSLAYVIYTSGTTGRPKGVMITHRSIVNLVESDVREFGLGPGDRVAQNSSAAYDSSVEEVWLALSCGATLVVMDDDTVRLGPDLVGWLRAEAINVLCPPPTLLRTMACADPRGALPDLRLLYVGGEALPEDVAERWASGRRMVNGYGPTECTVTCLRADVVAGQPLTIGRPVRGMSAWVLDEDLLPVPDGEPGELCMSGVGLAAGYLNQPGLTAARFPNHASLGRLYRTGDLVHARPDGTIVYHGRIDSQVKLRGYRIELEAVETCLARCAGLREAACRVQGEGPAQRLAAFVVATDPRRPPDPDGLKAKLRASLPSHMVPVVIETIDALPRSASGKLQRSALPGAVAPVRQSRRAVVLPRLPVEILIARAVEEVLRPGALGVDDDFFADLGGSSLQAAMLISRLRTDRRTAALTVRDIYESRTVRRLAQRAAPPPSGDAPTPTPAVAPRASRPGGNPTRMTICQVCWLALELLILAPLGYLVIFRLLPWLAQRVGLVVLILLAPPVLALAGMAWAPLSILIAAQAKRTLIGRYVPERIPVWSGRHARMWMLRQVLRIVPWRRIAGTELQCVALRALGARIGQRVHIHRGVDLLAGGWDLLDIGDDVTLSQDASVGLVRLEEGHVVIGPVTLADGATLDVRAGVSPHTRLGRNSWLAALASLPVGGCVGDDEAWDGIPARRVGRAPEPPAVATTGRTLAPLAHGIATLACRTLLDMVLAAPFVPATLTIVLAFQLTYTSLLSALAHPLSHGALLSSAAVLSCLGLVGDLALQALAARALGRVTEGVVNRWSPIYIRLWLTTGLVDSAGRWLSGGLYWPVWLRWAGMRVARGCELSTIIDVMPRQVHIAADTFLADGIYLGGPRVHRGTVTLAAVRLSQNTFLGNHAVVPAGQRLPPDILVGICTVADDRLIRPGTSWFGHPPFELPRREIVACDRTLTHRPPPVRVLNRLFWEYLRFALPIGPLMTMVAWVYAIAWAQRVMPSSAVLVVGAAMVALGAAALPCLFVLALKWMLLGRVRPGGVHPLWSCWCSRWDFLYVAWRFLTRGILTSLEGTLLLAVYLRRMGMRIGRRVVLSERFVHVADPDMLTIDDDATVNAMFQAHTFEDRVLKIDRIHVGSQSTLAQHTVPLYGARIGARAYVAPHSVVMKYEQLRPDLRYEGAPTKTLR